MAARSRSEKRLDAAYNEPQGRSLIQRKHTILRLGRYMIQYKWLLLLAFVMTVGSNLLALVGPMLSGYAIDAIEPGIGKVDFSRVFHYAGWMAAFYVISSVLSYALSVLMITISRKVVYRMRKDVFDKMLALPAGYYDLHQTGDIISRISYDIDTVNESLSSDLIQILTTVITVAGALYMMVVISPEAGVGICLYGAALRLYYKVRYRQDSSSFPGKIGKSGEFKRVCGGDGNRPEDVEGLLPGGTCDSKICGEE